MAHGAKGERATEKALFTPKTATVWVKETVAVENRQIVLDLPPQAMTDSLNIQILEPEGLSIESISEEWIEERMEKEVQELTEKIKAIEKQKDALKASQDVVESEIEAWEEQIRQKRDQLQDLISLMEEAQRRLGDLRKQALQISYDVKSKDDELEQLNRRLHEMTGSKKKTKRIYCNLVGLSEDTKEVSVRYWFTMKEAQWRPAYRLELFPSEKRLSFIWEAEVTQRSGIEWSNVDVSLATSEPTRFAQPPDLPNWKIEPARPVAKKSYGEGDVMMQAAPSPPTALYERARPEVYQEEKSAFSVYRLGRRDIASGKTARFRIIDKDWQVEVRYLLRPFVSSWAFVQAKVDFQETFQLPPGEGLFFLDGTFISRSNVAVRGLSHVFSFGPDPLVTSKLVLEERQTGRKGFIKGKQTFSWKWFYEVENTHSFPITLILEERKPQAGDERIQLKFVELPSFKAIEDCTPDRWCWEVPMKEREKKTLRFAVQAEAPEDMEIFPGW